MLVLGIESSCDETGVALVDNGKIVIARIATQEIHANWGGVVPELASRLHQRTLAKMVEEALSSAGVSFNDLQGVVATHGPGLIGALLVAVSYAKGLSVALKIPYAGVNHLEGHIWAACANGEELPLPALAMLVSGGHTELVRIDAFGSYKYLGGTLDDAVGEAFDKVGGLLDLAYPAGPKLSKLAKGRSIDKFKLPVAITKNDFDFSFSGLKSAALREVKKNLESSDESWKADLASSFQNAAVKQLTSRLDRALKKFSYKSILLAGGVAANHKLREEAAVTASSHGVKLVVPPVEWCTDNGAMIAWLGEKLLVTRGGDELSTEANPNLPLVALER